MKICSRCFEDATRLVFHPSQLLRSNSCCLQLQPCYQSNRTIHKLGTEDGPVFDGSFAPNLQNSFSIIHILTIDDRRTLNIDRQKQIISIEQILVANIYLFNTHSYTLFQIIGNWETQSPKYDIHQNIITTVAVIPEL